MRTFTAIRRLAPSLTAFSIGLSLACAATAAPPRLDLSRLASPYDAGQAMKAAGIAHTAIDHSLPGQAATASVGFLCGGQPNTGTSGAAGALGVDRDGRFVGAQLRLGFR